MHFSQKRHTALLKVVKAISDAELQAAHRLVMNQLLGMNIWVVVTKSGILLSRDWPEPPGVATVSFPDQSTALRTCSEIQLPLGEDTYRVGVISYDAAIKTSNDNSSLLVMVTYDGDVPHYVPISHLEEK